MDNISEIRATAYKSAYATRQKALDKLNTTPKIKFKIGDQMLISNSWRTSKLDYYYLNNPLTFQKVVATNIAELLAEDGSTVRCHFYDMRLL